MDWDLVLWGGMEVPMETCPFMSRLYLPRYICVSFFSSLFLYYLKKRIINVRFGLGDICGI